MERAEILDSARQAFGGSLAPDADTAWAMLGDMGWFTLTVPEAKGGLGLGAEALAAIHYELGRALVPGPVIAQMLAVEALAVTGEDDALTRAMAGERLTCDLIHALDADRAKRALLVSDDSVKLASIGSAVQRQSWDETRRLFDLSAGDGGLVLAQGVEAAALADYLRGRLCLMLAADSLGGADAALAMTIDYLKMRRQFDRPIAMFQALKHRVADLRIALSAAEALLWSRAGQGDASLTELGALKALATRTYRLIAEEAIQLHGGIGLTAEHPCHLFLKRAMLNAALGGDGDYWDERAGRAVAAA